MIRNLKKTLCLFVGGVALFSLCPSSAKAQHVVTEYEAGKLTLSSLTAAPAIRYRAKKINYAKARNFSNVRTVSYRTTSKSSLRNSRLVHNVAYKHKVSNKIAVKNAVYNVSSSKKTAKHRHRS